MFINLVTCVECETDEVKVKEVHAVEMNYKNALTEKKEEKKVKKIGSIEFLGDTGAQMHCVMIDPGMRNVKTIKLDAKFGNDSTSKINTKGDLLMKSEEGIGIELKDVHVVPGCSKNIVSLTQLQKEGWDYHTKHGKLFLCKGKAMTTLKEGEKHLHYLKLTCLSEAEKELYPVTLDKEKKLQQWYQMTKTRMKMTILLFPVWLPETAKATRTLMMKKKNPRKKRHRKQHQSKRKLKKRKKRLMLQKYLIPR